MACFDVKKKSWIKIVLIISANKACHTYSLRWWCKQINHRSGCILMEALLLSLKFSATCNMFSSGNGLHLYTFTLFYVNSDMLMLLMKGIPTTWSFHHHVSEWELCIYGSNWFFSHPTKTPSSLHGLLTNCKHDSYGISVSKVFCLVHFP